MTTAASKRKRGEIDWNEMYRRLEEARKSIERPVKVDQDKILRERAARLAKPMAQAEPEAQSGRGIEVIEFRSAGERYAFETAHVAQVYPVGPITVIPGVPDFVVGIIAAQGNVLSVIDLRTFLNLPLSSLAEPAAIIVLEGENMEVGILAEEILGIQRYCANSLERGLPGLGSVESTCLLGVTSGRTAILDAPRLLSDPRLVVDIG